MRPGRVDPPVNWSFIKDEVVRRSLPLFLWFGRERERIALAPARLRCTSSLGLGNVSGVNRDDASTAPMRGHHHSVALFLAHSEFGLEYRDDELPWRVVIVDQNDLVKARSFYFRQGFDARLGDDFSHRSNKAVGVLCEPNDVRTCVLRSISAEAACPQRGSQDAPRHAPHVARHRGDAAANDTTSTTQI
jgi:hypothetical protein